MRRWGKSPVKGFKNVREYIVSKAVITDLVVKDGKVVNGLWYCFYTGKLYRMSEDKPDIDHIVPLKGAYIRGADKWSNTKRRKFANDPDNLIAVYKNSNRQKSSMLSKWLPPNVANADEYIQKIEHIVKKYQLKPTMGDWMTYRFLAPKLKKWSKGVSLDPVKSWFKKTFGWKL